MPWPQVAAAGSEPVPGTGSAAPDDPPVLVDDPSPAAASAPAPAGRLFEDYGGTASTLDRIEVTGSRIKRVDLETSAPTLRIDREGLKARDANAPMPGSRPRDGDTPEPSRTLRARVRSEFADTALWMPDIHLAPGESRTIDLKLPDNLTRWRAVAWSGDSGDDFAMAQATLETGLPVEVRLQAPVRIYPGDRARLATSVRQTGETAVVALAELHAEGAGAPIDNAQRLSLTARGQGSVAVTIAADTVGMLQLTAAAETPTGRDAVVLPLEVASPLIPARKLQAGWLHGATLMLDLPVLPASARDPQLQVALLRGDAGLVERWSEDLRVYPHRCWEQILSRAVGAALSLERHDASWPDADADAVVREALDNAAVFQDDNGGFRYFVGAERQDGQTPDSSVTLTAYTVQGVRAASRTRSSGPGPDRRRSARVPRGGPARRGGSTQAGPERARIGSAGKWCGLCPLRLRRGRS